MSRKVVAALAAVVIVAGIAAVVVATSPARPQSSPNLSYGQVPTAGQWNSYFAGKLDYSGFTPLNPANNLSDVASATTAATNLGVGNVGELYAYASVNFNAGTTDTALTVAVPAAFSRIQVVGITVSGASASLSSSTLGVFTATGGGGATVAANQSVTVTSGTANTNNNAQNLTLTNSTTEVFTLTGGLLYARVGTPQGVAATGNVLVRFVPIP